MRLYIIRHADPDYEHDTITQRGHREAKALADRLVVERIDHLYSSPLGRARATAAYTARAKGLDCRVLDWTAELDWHVETTMQREKGSSTPWDVHGHIIRSLSPLPRQDDWHLVPPFDVSRFKRQFDELVACSDAFLAEHGYERDGAVYRIRSGHRQALAVFCHGGFGLTWLAHLLMIPAPIMWAGFFLLPSSVTTIVFDERTDGIATPRCIGLADTAHLVAAGLCDSNVPAGICANYR